MIRNILFLIALCSITSAFSAKVVHRSRRNADTCGVPESQLGLIVHGQNFTRGAFPWLVALMYKEKFPPQFFCAGTLISKTFVVSAAHCIQQKHSTKQLRPRDILALFGAHDLENSFETGRFVLSPKEIFVHESWNPWTNQYDSDLSLLEFENRGIHVNDVVQPICLWDSENEPAVTEGFVAGWGKSEDSTKKYENIPKMVKALIQSNEDCFLEEGRLLDLSSKKTFCAGLRNGSGVCRGDSGGGLFMKVDGVFHLRGIVSSALNNIDGSCDVWKNAIYTNVLKFRDWIEDKITPTARKVFCFFTINYGKKTCKVNQNIEEEHFVIGSPKNSSIERFDASKNKQIKFLPRGIGEKFPNLKEFWAFHCGLTIVRDFYFKNMKKLEKLYLNGNQIKTIEPKAFDDLVSLSYLTLQNNLIETLDEKLFVNLINLVEISLHYNKIKLLSPTSFKIPGNRKLNYVTLRDNVCINKYYAPDYSPLSQLETDLMAKCKQ